jgi:hypothetical protein
MEKAIWKFVENYPHVGACFFDGIVIIPLNYASQELIDNSLEAQAFLNKPF